MIKERVLDAIVGFGLAAVFFSIGHVTHARAWEGLAWGTAGATAGVLLVGNGALRQILMGLELMLKRRP